jgi:hypothetical protein
MPGVFVVLRLPLGRTKPFAESLVIRTGPVTSKFCAR